MEKYKEIKKLGKGAQGSCYLVHHLKVWFFHFFVDRNNLEDNFSIDLGGVYQLTAVYILT